MAQTKKFAPLAKKLVKSTGSKSIGSMLNEIYDTLTQPVLKQAACIIQYSGTAGKITITRSPGLISAAAHSKLAVLEGRKSKIAISEYEVPRWHRFGLLKDRWRLPKQWKS